MYYVDVSCLHIPSEEYIRILLMVKKQTQKKNQRNDGTSLTLATITIVIQPYGVECRM